VYGSFRVIDGDRHYNEPTAMWAEYVEPRYREVAVTQYADGNGYTWTRFDKTTTEQELAQFGDQMTRRREGPHMSPGDGIRPGGSRNPGGHPTWDDGHPGGFEPRLNLKDMDVDQIDVAVLYPTAGLTIPLVPDPGLSMALCRALNNWVADYCRADPARLLGIGIVTLHDPELAVRELRRIARDLGFKAVMVRPDPSPPAPPSRTLHDRAFDPVWATYQELGLSLSIHAGLDHLRGRMAGMDRFQTTLERHTICHPFEQMLALVSMITGGVMERFPSLKVAFLESGCGWLPFWLERLDEHFEMLHWETPELKLRPSEYFQRQGYISCEAGEATLPCVIEHVGAHKILFASDYPHFDMQFPGVVAALTGRSDLSDDAKRWLLHDTTVDFYNLTV
jgi:predicted TIM-barrel fold metal-dependent hydrolase